jgi:hypothetical protein
MKTDFKAPQNYCEPTDTIHLRFGVKGFGFGELYFYFKDDKIYCDNEFMDKETIKQIINIMVDKSILTCI